MVVVIETERLILRHFRGGPGDSRLRVRKGFDRLIAVIQPGNLASQNVARKNGMGIEKDVDAKGIAASVYVINSGDPRPIG